jgi:hypothetical protein
MAKVFYTERDIEDLHARGVATLDIHDDVVLTDLARERALKLGVRLVRVTPKGHIEDRDDAALFHRVKAAVLARLGDQAVDPALLDAVIARVLASLGR